MSPSPTMPQSGDVLVFAGTKKGLFMFWADEGRRNWKRGQQQAGWMVHATAFDPRDGKLYAATNSEVFGGVVQRSNDLGRTWEKEVKGLKFDDD